MKKAMTVMVALAAVLTASAAEWINGGVAEGWPTATTLSGGAWTNTESAAFANGAVSFANASAAPLTFAATAEKTPAEGEIAISSTVDFTARETLPAPTAKAGVVSYDGYFYVLAKDPAGTTNIWTNTDIAATATATVNITFPSATEANYTINDSTYNATIASVETIQNVKLTGIGTLFALTATATAPMVTVTVAEVTGASKVTVSNETVEVVGEGEPPVYTVVSNTAVKVIYTADDGYVFPDGAATWETNFTASAATTAVEIPESEKPTQKATDVEYLEPVYKEIGGVASVTNGIDHWVTNTVSEYTVVESSESAVTWGTDGATSWYVVKNGTYQIDGGVVCAGHVNLVLCDGAKLTVTNVETSYAGIMTTDANGSFTVYETPDSADAASTSLRGTLSVTGGDYAAGIGGGDSDEVDADCSSITINGGIVMATGIDLGAGIGGGNSGNGSDITVNGGSVTATGGESAAAGIGGGDGGNGSGITVNGGKVTATGGFFVDENYGFAIYSGAGIGGGNSGNGSDITVNGGSVTATGGESAAGIGGGYEGAGSDITVNGGMVTATGGLYVDESLGYPCLYGGAGIGGGYDGDGSNITINGGEVTATGESAAVDDYVGSAGAGIGGGTSGSGLNITINGGSVTATGGASAAGIGGGSYGAGSDIMVNGGEVTATGGNYAAGIGGGSAGAGSDITVNGGMVTVTGGYDAAGIGGGCEGAGSNITVNGGEVTATGGAYAAGIGGGYKGAGSNITIREATVFASACSELYKGVYYYPDVIGNGENCEDVSTGNTIDDSAKVFFNLTGLWNSDTKGLIEEIAPMPETFEGFVIMTRGTQSVDRVLVRGAQGLSALPAFSLTNAVTGATGTIAVNGEMVYFAERFLSLTNDVVAGNLVLKTAEPVTVTVAEVTGASKVTVSNETVEVIGEGEPPVYTVVSNTAVKVIYTADDGYVFPDGAATWETNFTASAATTAVEIPESEKPTQKATDVEYLEPVYKEIGGVASVTNGIDHWVTNTVSEYTVVESSENAVTWGTDGATSWYVVKNGTYQIDGGVVCAGHVNLVLCDGAKLTVTNVETSYAGIMTTDANGSFTVYETPDSADAASTSRRGTLSVTGGDYAAGIGGGDSDEVDADCSSITINGGIVMAMGIDLGAGIGGGYGGNGSGITVNGGTVTATGGEAAAGIGGGDEGAGSDITVNGGSVTATGGAQAAGIGGGSQGAGSDITVNGGEVTTTGGLYVDESLGYPCLYGGAGIGGGYEGDGSNITINGGKVVTTSESVVVNIEDGYDGGAGAGIGGGDGGNGSGITVNGGEVTATSGASAAGIGGGNEGDGSNITINGGIVTAAGNAEAAGIGGGNKGDGSDITINGGEVTATGGCYGAGIGGGYDGSGLDITVNGSNVTAMGGEFAAGIGGGQEGAGSNITLNGGSIKATGGKCGAGIGGGYKGAGSNISIREATVFASVCSDIYKGVYRCPNVIGNGINYEDVSTGNTIDDSAKVFFNLTGLWNSDTKGWIEEIAPMPETFEGFVIMTRGTQTIDRVLVRGAQGLSALPAFSLTNAVTGATGTIAVNGEMVYFAERFLSLTNDVVAGNLVLKTAEPVTVTVAEVTGASKVTVSNETVEVIGEGEPPVYTVVSNTAVKIIYTADEGYVFPDGAATWETNFTASAATTAVTLPAEQQPKLIVAEYTINGGALQKTWNAAIVCEALTNRNQNTWAKFLYPSASIATIPWTWNSSARWFPYSWTSQTATFSSTMSTDPGALPVNFAIEAAELKIMTTKYEGILGDVSYAITGNVFIAETQIYSGNVGTEIFVKGNVDSYGLFVGDESETGYAILKVDGTLASDECILATNSLFITKSSGGLVRGDLATWHNDYNIVVSGPDEEGFYTYKPAYYVDDTYIPQVIKQIEEKSKTDPDNFAEIIVYGDTTVVPDSSQPTKTYEISAGTTLEVFGYDWYVYPEESASGEIVINGIEIEAEKKITVTTNDANGVTVTVSNDVAIIASDREGDDYRTVVDIYESAVVIDTTITVGKDATGNAKNMAELWLGNDITLGENGKIVICKHGIVYIANPDPFETNYDIVAEGTGNGVLREYDAYTGMYIYTFVEGGKGAFVGYPGDPYPFKANSEAEATNKAAKTYFIESSETVVNAFLNENGLVREYQQLFGFVWTGRMEDGYYIIKSELKAEVTNSVTEVLNAAVAEIGTDFLARNSGKIMVETKPGLWYGIRTSTTTEGLNSGAITWTLGTGGTVELKFEPNLGKNEMFYRGEMKISKP